jgi:predicted transcriptional regulator
MLDPIRPNSADHQRLAASLSGEEAELARLLNGGALSGEEKPSVLAALIAMHYVRHSSIEPDDLVAMVRSLREVLGSNPDQKRPEPAVPVAQSITDQHIICLEDGHPCTSLQAYLKRRFGMTADVYRQRWDLPADYPMVAPAYSRKRAAMAHAQKLGRYSRAKAPLDAA